MLLAAVFSLIYIVSTKVCCFLLTTGSRTWPGWAAIQMAIHDGRCAHLQVKFRTPCMQSLKPLSRHAALLRLVQRVTHRGINCTPAPALGKTL